MPISSWCGMVCQSQARARCEELCPSVEALAKGRRGRQQRRDEQLGPAYQNGEGVAQDYAQARQWFQKAADAGNAEGMNNLGEMYRGALGGPRDNAPARQRDNALARQWFQKAADAGNAWGMYNVGEMYEKGQGVVQDDARACEWYQKAAEAGNVTAMRRLGELYTSGGPGFAKNYHLAREWYQKAADKGDEKAKNALKGLPPS